MLEAQPVHAPPLTGGTWYNVTQPLTWADLRGKLVILDFWTYGCINCLHVLEELRAIEERFHGEPLVVIGVHSAKFQNEQDGDHIRAAIKRYDIQHPVVVDDHRRIWDAYAVRGWPTLVLVDPHGYIVGTLAGEGHGPQLTNAIAAALHALRSEGQLDDSPLSIQLEAADPPLTPLHFPGKLVADDAADRVYIADSGYHRVVITDRVGRLVATIGSGEAGRADGDSLTASFHRPQGLALDGNVLYVADTGNHLIRAIDLTTHTVSTIAGTGTQQRGRHPHGPALSTALNSPWDLAVDHTTIWMAMAGAHQIWALDRATGMVHVAAGDGAEGRLDGAAPAAAFAQPSGLALDHTGQRLFVADSESSCIRVLDLATQPISVTTLAGGDLFDFGLRDGDGAAARFQHPLGIAYADGWLYVADTYNHAIRRIDAATGHTRTLAGFTASGQQDGRGKAARFFEPGGLAVAGDDLLVADTNNHVIRIVKRANGETHTLEPLGVCAPGFCLP